MLGLMNTHAVPTRYVEEDGILRMDAEELIHDVEEILVGLERCCLCCSDVLVLPL